LHSGAIAAPSVVIATQYENWHLNLFSLTKKQTKDNEMKLRRKHKLMVQFLYGIQIDTWPRRMRGPKIKSAIEWCKENPKWDNLWDQMKTTTKPEITAITLPETYSRLLVAWEKIAGFNPEHGEWKCHHVTLAYNKPWNRAPMGKPRRITITHRGVSENGVVAYKVSGADDSLNQTPHITVFVPTGCMPVESNTITQWIRIILPYDTFTGRIERL